MTTTLEEREVLKQVRPKIEELGYSFIDDFSSVLPSELRHYFPDFVAQKGDDYLAIEIKRNRSPASWAAINRLEKIFSKLDNWQLFVHFTEDVFGSGQLEKQTSEEILDALGEAEKAFKGGYRRSGFLTVWAALEAKARSLHSKIFSKPQTPGRIITVLAERGYLDPDTADALRLASQKRNALIHGKLDIEISDQEFEDLVAAVKTLEKGMSKS